MMSSLAQQLILLSVGCISLAPSYAADPGARTASTLGSTPDPLAVTNLWQLLMGLLLVLGLIAAIALLLKHSGRFQMSAGGGLRILGGLSIGARERVVLLQVGDTQLLVGVAPGRVQTLHILDKPLQAASSTTAVAPGFADQLGRLLRKENTR